MELICAGAKSLGLDTSHGYSKGGEFVLSVDHAATVNQVCIDASHFYTTGTRTSNLTTRKYSLDGSLVWSYDHGLSTSGIAVDQSGNVYITGNRIGGVTTRKLNSSGVAQWSVDYSGGETSSNAVGVCVDQSGNVFVVGSGGIVNPTNRNVEKLDSSGSVVWFVDDLTPNAGRCIALDPSDGSLYVGTTPATTTNYVLHKISAAGAIVWQKDINSSSSMQVAQVAVGVEGNVYTANGILVGQPGMRAWDSAGNTLWDKYTATAINGVATDADGYVYVSKSLGFGLFNELIKLDSSGNEIWTSDPVAPLPQASNVDVLPGRQGAFG